MSSQVSPIFGTSLQTSLFYRVIATVSADASGGTVQVNSNLKFPTNLPLDKAMQIIRIVYFNQWVKLPATLANPSTANWAVFVQLTEALARTAVAGTDPVFVDDLFFTIEAGSFTTSGGTPANPIPSQFERYPFWLTAAQQLNLIVSVQPNTVATNGPSVTVSAVIEYQLVSLTDQLRNYLATRVQIAGQA